MCVDMFVYAYRPVGKKPKGTSKDVGVEKSLKKGRKAESQEDSSTEDEDTTEPKASGRVEGSKPRRVCSSARCTWVLTHSGRI